MLIERQSVNDLNSEITGIIGCLQSIAAKTVAVKYIPEYYLSMMGSVWDHPN